MARGEGDAGGGERGGCGRGGGGGGGDRGVGVDPGGVAGAAGGEVEQQRDADRHRGWRRGISLSLSLYLSRARDDAGRRRRRLVGGVWTRRRGAEEARKARRKVEEVRRAGVGFLSVWLGWAVIDSNSAACPIRPLPSSAIQTRLLLYCLWGRRNTGLQALRV